MSLPTSEGTWLYKAIGEEVDVYYLPTGHLCVWCEDVGIQSIDESWWSNDEWLGHIPVEWLDDDPEGKWEFVSSEFAD